MRSLFWKTFLAFWLLLALLLAVNGALNWWQLRQYEDPGRFAAWAAELAEQAVSVYERAGNEGLRRWQQRLARESELHTLLLDEAGNSLTGEPLPGRLRHRLSGGHERHGVWRHRERPLIWPYSSPGGRRYQFVVINPGRQLGPWMSGSALAWRLGLSLLVIALIAALFTHYLTRPIRQLQDASRRLADGQLETRVGGALRARRDELGQLGADFDRMASHLQSLLEGQRRMLRDISHELRTPLARQRIALELARQRSQGGERELCRIERESERLEALIDEILWLVRMDTPQSLKAAPLDLAALVRSVVEDANFEQRRVLLKGPDRLDWQGDGELLRRAVENLIRNGLKYSPADAPVEVVLEQWGAEDGGARLRVRDQGPGVDEGQLPLLFEPFYRADASRQRPSGGYGLGLAIAARAVRLHGGRIAARNHSGSGLEVEICLPAAGR